MRKGGSETPLTTTAHKKKAEEEAKTCSHTPQRMWLLSKCFSFLSSTNPPCGWVPCDQFLQYIVTSCRDFNYLTRNSKNNFFAGLFTSFLIHYPYHHHHGHLKTTLVVYLYLGLLVFTGIGPISSRNLLKLSPGEQRSVGCVCDSSAAVCGLPSVFAEPTRAFYLSALI